MAHARGHKAHREEGVWGVIGFLAYLIFTVIPAANHVFFFLAFFGCMAGALGSIAAQLEDFPERYRKLSRKVLTVGLVCVVLAVLTPSRREVLYIAGTVLGVEVATLFAAQDGADKVPQEIVEALRRHLKGEKE